MEEFRIVTTEQLAKQISDATGMTFEDCKRHLMEMEIRLTEAVKAEFSDIEKLLPIHVATKEPKQKNALGFLDGLNYKGSRHQNQRFSQHFKK